MTTAIRETDGEIVRATRAMYARLGDRAGFDAHLHPDVTIWESDQPGGLIGLAELDALRDRRTSAPGEPAAPVAPAGPPPVVEVRDPVVDRWQETAVIRYVLHAEAADGESSFRVTDVLQRHGQEWLIVHHHAEQVGERASAG
ncbi:nuclear transport factor 2 family protein [Nocardioides nitrophenolicus]|uniref:nuclear transport factor 2 family protein n=1 Tax=Nocardioides nitrophenolicus TaxID=60489 RepID=UPI00195AA4E2|nr:nuclear transport factor 2 family protein [Nocardioides nitrophenolicus]MBM7518535.1 hypothetical protein [Nocardioides nitrophenolicus]